MAAAPDTEEDARPWQPRAHSGHWWRGRWMYLLTQEPAGSEPDIYTTEMRTSGVSGRGMGRAEGAEETLGVGRYAGKAFEETGDGRGR